MYRSRPKFRAYFWRSYFLTVAAVIFVIVYWASHHYY